jgi:type I restriction enzyme S subunit
MSSLPLIRLHELVEQMARAVRVQSKDVYRLLGVRIAGKGPFLREIRTGAEISAKILYQVKGGDFIYSRLFAWQGAFGVISDELDGCFVSNEFPLFRVNPDRLDASYLYYWFRLPDVLRRVETDCSGSTPLTRNRYKEKFFKHLQIPLPPLDIQRRIVAQLDGVATRLAVLQTAAAAIEAELAAMLRAAFDRAIAGATYCRLEDVAPIRRRPVAIDQGKTYAELGVRSFGRGLFDKPLLIGGELTWQKLFEIKEGDLVFSNIKAWEGAFAVARKRHHGMVGSHRYLTCVPDTTRVTADSLWFYLQSPEGLLQIQEASPGSADRNRTLSQKGLSAIKVPVPSSEVQQWFNTLQRKAADARSAHVAAEAEARKLLPAILDRVFGGEL